MEKKEKNIKKRTLPIWVIILIVVCFIFMFLPVIGIFGFLVYTGISDEINEGNLEKNLKMVNNVEAIYDENSNTYVVSGYLKNYSDDEVYGLFIEYNLYDKDGNVIGIATSDLNRLDEGKTWHFSAEYTGYNAKDVVSYELDEIDGDDELY